MKILPANLFDSKHPEKDPSLFEISDLLLNQSPTYRKLSRFFFLCAKAIAQKKMIGFWMSNETIGRKVGCHERTVRQYLHDNSRLIVRFYRKGKTTNLRFTEKFFRAMEFLNDFDMLETNRRRQKRFLMGVLKQTLGASIEMVDIHPPPGSFSSSITFINPKNQVPKERSAHLPEKKGAVSKHLEQLPMSYEEKIRLSRHPEVAIVEAMRDFHWYSSMKKIDLPHRFLVCQIERHMGKRPWKDGKIRKSF